MAESVWLLLECTEPSFDLLKCCCIKIRLTRIIRYLYRGRKQIRSCGDDRPIKIFTTDSALTGANGYGSNLFSLKNVMQYFYCSVKLHQEDMIGIRKPRILLHTTRYPVKNTYSLNVHEYSCNDCYSWKQFITKPYDTFNHLTDPRGCVELISTYGGICVILATSGKFWHFFFFDFVLFKVCCT